MKSLSLFVLLAPLVVPVIAEAHKGVPKDSELYRTIAAQDAALFEAFNKCDVEKFASFFIEDLEFYHDNDGLARGRQHTVDALKNNICGKVTRELVAGSLEVYPLANYGAIEIGVHRFHHPGREALDGVGEASFFQVWQNTNGTWKITRVFSYDHHALPKAGPSAKP